MDEMYKRKKEGRMDAGTNRRKDGWMDGWIKGLIEWVKEGRKGGRLSG